MNSTNSFSEESQNKNLPSSAAAAISPFWHILTFISKKENKLKKKGAEGPWTDVYHS